VIDLLRQLNFIQWRLEGGAVWDNCPSRRPCSPVNGVPLAKMRYLVPIEVETDKKYSN